MDSPIELYISKTNCDFYEENTVYYTKIKKKIGEGNYGTIYEFENEKNHVLKLFKLSNVDNTVMKETDQLIPFSSENREWLFFENRIHKKEPEDSKYLISIYAIGYTKSQLKDRNILYRRNTYFLILPRVYPFYSLTKKKTDFTDEYIIQLMKRLLEISIYLENKHKKINFDLRLQNCAYLSESEIEPKELIILDFGLLKNMDSRRIVDMTTNYYLWPVDKTYSMENIHTYIVCINALELLFDKDEIHKRLPNESKIRQYLFFIKNRNECLYDIFMKGLFMKCDTPSFLEWINQFS